MPPPSSGGIALVEMLNMLEALDIQKKPRGSVEALHLMTEAMRRAYLDRARFLGDPDFVQVPVDKLTSKPHARELIKTIDPKHASSSAELGKDIVTVPQAPEPEDTTHFSVVDKDGMAVSNTYTLEGGYGSHVVIKGTGILLNNEMGDFNKKPGDDEPDGRHRHAAEPHRAGQAHAELDDADDRARRTASSCSSPDRRAAARSSTRCSTSCSNVTAWDLTGREAVDAPRMHHQWLPDTLTIEADGVSDKTLEAVKALGHNARMQRPSGIRADDLDASAHGHGVRRRGYEGSDGEGEQGGRSVGSADSTSSTGSTSSVMLFRCARLMPRTLSGFSAEVGATLRFLHTGAATVCEIL